MNAKGAGRGRRRGSSIWRMVLSIQEFQQGFLT